MRTRFTQTHSSSHFNERWCNRRSDELAVNQGLVNVNELPIVGVGKMGLREEYVSACLSQAITQHTELQCSKM